ncbi:MAG: secretin N-terminal domain-containing protein [Pseudomonadota bacterium]
MRTEKRQVGSAFAIAVALSVGLSGCSSSTKPTSSLYLDPKPQTVPAGPTPSSSSFETGGSAQTSANAAQAGAPGQTTEPGRTFSTVPSIANGAGSQSEAGDATPPPMGVARVDTLVPPLALPEFIDLVFGEMLQTPYVTGPGISNSDEIVQLRSSGEMEADVFLDLVRQALQDYGVRIAPENGVYQIVKDSALTSRLPRFVRSRAHPTTPMGLRPIVQFIELNAIRAQDMENILQQAFDGREGSLSIRSDIDRNYVILNGLPEDVGAALDIINEMDELRYAGTQVQRYAPIYWNASNLAMDIARILTAEGWQVGASEGDQKAILLLPIDQSNDLLVFSRTPTARTRVNYWIRELDRAAQTSDEPQLYVYNVRNLDAEILAETVNRVLAATDGGISDQGPTREDRQRELRAALAEGRPPPVESAAVAAIAGRNDRIVVDPYGNRLIFSGTPREFARLRSLIDSIDQPASEVLIEATIAQVTLSDSINSGVEWVINNIGGMDAFDISQGGLGLGGGGLDVAVRDFSGDTDAVVDLNAFAENSQVSLLATPRIVARSGSSARVQVGSEVPTLSAQRVGVGGGLNNDVVSSVVYRSTGIILEIEPIVFADGRIDLNIRQEVSSTAAGTGDVSSPTFNNTSVATQLSLDDGSTAVIGGLIQDNLEETERGIPILKDLPLVGQAFAVNATSADRTELVILITAYVLRDKHQKEALAKALAAGINRTMNSDNLVTLRPRERILDLEVPSVTDDTALREPGS